MSGGYYARNEGKQWITTMLLAAGLFPCSVFSIAFVLNTVAIFYTVRLVANRRCACCAPPSAWRGGL